jgi:signal transduction histidine kinase
VSRTVAALLLSIPALLWTIIADSAWRDGRGNRPEGTPIRLALVAALTAAHYSLAAVMELVPTDLGWQAPGLRDGLGMLEAFTVVSALAVLQHEGSLATSRLVHKRSRSWLTANYGAAAVTLAAIPLPLLMPTAANWLAWFYSLLVLFLYCIIVTSLVLRDLTRRVRRGAWRPGGLATPRSLDVALVASGLGLLGVLALVIGMSFGLGLSRSAGSVLLGVHVGLGLVFAAVPAVRILGTVVRRFVLLATMMAATGAVYFWVPALTTSLVPELRRLVELAAVLALVLVFVPGQVWLRDVIDRLLFRRRVRQAEVQAFLHTLSPELGALECCRRALAEIARIMALRGAAILLRDGQSAVHGAFTLAPILRVWPSGAATDELPTLPFDGSALRDPRLAEAMVEAEVVGIVPLLSPRQRWGHLFVTTGLLGATFIDEDVELVSTFADQLALVLDGADLLTRAVAVERAMAHAEKLAAIGELAARIAHEIRNPVTAARSLAQQLSHDPTSPLNAEHAQLILTELERVERQVAALLRFARREEFQLEPTDVSLLVRTTVEELRARLDEVEVHVEVDAGDGVTVRADREKLRQVLINLIENAMDALGEATGPRRLAVDVGRVNGTATICLSDNGPGVPQDALPRLFEPFFSLKTTGTGLGLAIARRTVEAHGGRIEASGMPGTGLTLRLELPLAEGRHATR